MNKIRITKEFYFEMAHVLDNHAGLCKNIHGHSYKFEVTLIGNPSTIEGDPSNGMVIDFGLLKNIINENIIQKFDHALVICNQSKFLKQFQNLSNDTKLITVAFQPTCENLLLHFVDLLKNKFPDNVKLFSMLLRETPSSYAEWFLEDNI